MCIGISGTEIKYSALDEDELFLTKDKISTEAFKDGPNLLERAVDTVREYLKLWGADGICISTAGMVDVGKREIFYSAPLIPDYAGAEIKTGMESEFGPPCKVENDVNCAELSEVVSGAAIGSRFALCLTVGTGIGDCIIIDGNVYHDFSNSTCGVGYMHIEGSDFQTLGATSILASKVALVKGESARMWSSLRTFELAKTGDSVCIQAIDDMCDVLGKRIPDIYYVVNPQVMVLGGGVMAQEKCLRPRIRAAMDRYLVSSIREEIALAFTQHGNDAGMRGTCYHFKERQG